MQKLILDTNIIVSALISNSIPTKILYELVLTQKVKTCLSDEKFAEYIEVMNREKFTKYPTFQTSSFYSFIFGHCTGRARHRIATTCHWVILFSGC